MKHWLIVTALLALLAAPLTALAAEATDFEVKTTADLLNLCTASPGDNLYAEAINFCQGYLVGAYHYYAASTTGPNSKTEFCFPEPKPTRNEAIGMFVAWAKAHPEYHKELPVETEFRFLHETWPCKQ